PDLLPHLRYPVGREPLLPVRVVGQVGGGESGGCTRGISLRGPLGVLPTQGGEGHDAGIEPHVADLGNALDFAAAGLTPHAYGVDPGTAQLLQLLDASDGALLELGLGSDHGEVATRAR